jgi:hypothetical protein
MKVGLFFQTNEKICPKIIRVASFGAIANCVNHLESKLYKPLLVSLIKLFHRLTFLFFNASNAFLKTAV